MPRATAALALALALSVPAPAALAQAPPALPDDAPLTLRPTRGARHLASAVARTLALRLSVPVSVGDAPPPEILEAVPPGHVAIARRGGTIELVLAGPETQVYRSEVAVRRQSDQAIVRAVALAVEALRDAALDGPPPGESPSVTRRTFELRGQSVTWIYREREGGLFGPRRRREAEAKPSFYLGAVGGLTTEQLGILLGPRLGLALCLDPGCLALEADVPVLPQESVACDGRRLQYRPVTLGLRLSMRPLNVDRVVFFGFSFGVISRFGIASLVGAEVNRLSTDFGVRSGLEVAWRFAPPVEIALEVGVDVNVSPVRFVRETRPPPGVVCPTLEPLFAEDIVTLWAALVVRVRP